MAWMAVLEGVWWKGNAWLGKGDLHGELVKVVTEQFTHVDFELFFSQVIILSASREITY